jgi:septal ring factor EnvC (AmiA/AmiB activator)
MSVLVLVLPCVQAPAGSPPDIWVQLLERCAAEQAAQPAVFGSVVRELQQQREQAAQQAAQLQEQQEQAAQLATQLQQQVTQQAVQLQQQEQELEATRAVAAAAAAEAAGLQGRVQALEGQLQEVLAALRRQTQG